MRKNKGYTLLELLVANTLGLMVLAGVVQVFSANSQSIRVLNANSNVQEGGRIALELLSRDIRMADFWGCMPNPSSILNHLDTTDPDYDADIHNPTTSAGIDGANNVGTLTIDGITVRPGTDVLYLRGVAPNPDVKITPPYMPTTSADIHINTGVTTLPQGTLILITNCNGGDFFTNTSNNTVTNGNVIHNTGVDAAGVVKNASKNLSQTYSGDALISTLVSKSIFVGANTRGGWSLYRYDQQNDDMMELIPNVTDLQFKYGENNGTDDSVDQYGDAGDATINMDNVIAIHTTLVMASADQTVFTSSGSPAPLQREYSATTTIRNRLLR